METLDQDFQQTPNQLTPTRQMREDWRVIAQWANFIAIVGFIFIGIFALLILSIPALMTRIGEFGGGSSFELEIIQAMGAGFTVLMFVLLGIQFMINLFQFRFAKKLKQAVLFQDQLAFEEAWLQFRNLFRWNGIAIIAVIVLYIIAAITVWGFVMNSAL